MRVAAGETVPVSKLTSLLTEHGAPLTVEQVYRANTVTVDELARMLAVQRAAEVRAYAEQQRRIREDAMAREYA